MTARVILLAAPVLIAAGCFSGSDATEAQPMVVTETAARAQAHSAPELSGTCPLTLPNRKTPPSENDVGANHGNGKLWTAMWPHNVVIATPDYIHADGSVGMKWPWWWRGVRGKLTITGRRLDGEAPPLTAYTPNGYEDGFQPSGISFPTAGCWEVTGAVGKAKLTFVTLVLKASRYWPLEEEG